MRKSDLKIGKVVYFGTSKGPRTRAKILRLNLKSVTLMSLAKRDGKLVGSQWRVGYRDLFETKGVTSFPMKRRREKKKERALPTATTRKRRAALSKKRR